MGEYVCELCTYTDQTVPKSRHAFFLLARELSRIIHVSMHEHTCSLGHNVYAIARNEQAPLGPIQPGPGFVRG